MQRRMAVCNTDAHLLESGGEGAGRVALAGAVRTVGIGDSSAVAHTRVGRVDDQVGDGSGACAAVGGESGGRTVLERLLVVADNTAEDVLGLGAAMQSHGQTRSG